MPISLPTRQTENQWFKDGVKLIRDNLNRQPLTHTAKNTILFLGDGMGITTTTAARILAGQMFNQSGEEYVLSWEKFPWSALSKTYNVDQQVPDSAGTGTAFLNGVKTNAGKSKVANLSLSKFLDAQRRKESHFSFSIGHLLVSLPVAHTSYLLR